VLEVNLLFFGKGSKVIKELEGYEEKIILNNPRNPTLSRGNMNEIYFKKLVGTLN